MTDNHSPILIMIRGIPGSGKSFLAEAIRKKLDSDSVTVVDPDAIDQTSKEYRSFSKQLSTEGLDEAIHPFRWLRKRACDAIAPDHIIIWNQPFTIRGIFDRLIIFLKDHAHNELSLNLQILLVEVDIDIDIAKRRVVDRKKQEGHGPSDATFNRRVQEFESFADGYHTLIVDGQDNVKHTVDAILSELEQIRTNS